MSALPWPVLFRPRLAVGERDIGGRFRLRDGCSCLCLKKDSSDRSSRSLPPSPWRRQASIDLGESREKHSPLPSNGAIGTTGNDPASVLRSTPITAKDQGEADGAPGACRGTHVIPSAELG